MNANANIGKQAGYLLLEGMIAILIFSMGVLALVSMTATSVSQVSDAKYRVDASYLANQVIGQMWVSDYDALATNFNSPSGASYLLWKADVQGLLPGATSGNVPTIVVTGGAGAPKVATVTVRWQSTAGTPVHNFVAQATIGR